VQITSLRWTVGVLCAALGALMLIDPFMMWRLCVV
jgi:hypothetical protein